MDLEEWVWGCGRRRRWGKHTQGNNDFVFPGTGFVAMMRNGKTCWRKLRLQLSSASRGAPPHLATQFACCGWNAIVTMSHSQQWQEEEAGWGYRYSEQRNTPTRESKKEGNATRQIQEEQGQTQQIWEETVNRATLMGLCVQNNTAKCLVFFFFFFKLHHPNTAFLYYVITD